MKGHHKKEGISTAEEKAIEEGLAAIYGEERDDLGKMDKAGSRLTRYLVRTVTALAAIAVIGYLGFFVYMRFFATPGEDPFVMTIDAPDEIVSGTQTMVTIRYENTANVPMAAAMVDVNIPETFVVSRMDPSPTDIEELQWNIGTMGKKEQGSIVLEGTWLASVPTAKNVQALATYRPANFNADFDAVVSKSINTLSSALALTATGPEQVLPGEAANYAFVVTNTGDAVMPEVSMALTLPEGFFIESSTPTLEAGGEARWQLGDIAGGASQTVTVEGSFASTVADVQQVQAKASIQHGDALLVQGEASVFTDVEGNGMIVRLVGNGTSGDVTMDPGDPLRLMVGYQNTGETALSGISLLVDFQSEEKFPITWSSSALDGGRMTADGVRFDSLSLAAGEEKMKNLSFPIKETLAAGDAQSWKIVVHATLNGVTIKSQPLTISLNSDTAFSSSARYYNESGAPVGDGPLPPTVGETTEYEIVWTLENALHALRDAKAVATIPSNVTWVRGTTDYGTIAFDSGTRSASWEIPAIAADAGTVTATIRLSVTPDEDDVGRFMKLLSGTAFRATDTVTDATIQITTDSLTTELEGDEEAEGKGAVED